MATWLEGVNIITVLVILSAHCENELLTLFFSSHHTNKPGAYNAR